MMSAAAHVSAPQQIAATIDAAEAEGATFATRGLPATVSRAFARPFGGTAERKCVSLVPEPSGGSLRSGDFIIRTDFFREGQLRANRGHKVLWLPLHNPAEYTNTLRIRASVVGSVADSLRFSVADWAFTAGGPKSDSGFPSAVRFPLAGQWLVVATTREDWGCFLLRVAP
jgi:hypothetical protein